MADAAEKRHGEGDSLADEAEQGHAVDLVVHPIVGTALDLVVDAQTTEVDSDVVGEPLPLQLQAAGTSDVGAGRGTTEVPNVLLVDATSGRDRAALEHGEGGQGAAAHQPREGLPAAPSVQPDETIMLAQPLQLQPQQPIGEWLFRKRQMTTLHFTTSHPCTHQMRWQEGSPREPQSQEVPTQAAAAAWRLRFKVLPLKV